MNCPGCPRDILNLDSFFKYTHENCNAHFTCMIVRRARTNVRGQLSWRCFCEQFKTEEEYRTILQEKRESISKEIEELEEFFEWFPYRRYKDRIEELENGLAKINRLARNVTNGVYIPPPPPPPPPPPQQQQQ